MRKFVTLTKQLFKRYGKNGFLFLLLQGVTVGIQLFILPFLTRIFSQSDFGILQFSQTLINWFALFTIGNATFGAKKGIIEGKDGTMLYAFWYRMKFVMLLSLACFVSTLVLFVVGKVILAWVFVIVGLFLLVGYLPQVSFPQLYIAKDRFDLFVGWQSLTIVLSQVATVAVAFSTHNMLLTMAAQYFTFGLLCLLAFVMGLKRYHMIAAYKKGEIDRSCVPYGKKLILVEVIQGTAGTIHNFILGPVFGFATLAVFSVASRIDVLFRALISSGYYLLYKDFVQTDFENLKKHFKQKAFFLLVLSFLFSFLLFFASSFYIQKFLPVAYHGAILYTGILILGLPALLLQSIIQAALESRLKAEAQRLATYVSQLCRIIFLLIGGIFGVLGISISITVSAWVSTLCFVLVFFEPAWVKKKFIHRFLNIFGKEENKNPPV